MIRIKPYYDSERTNGQELLAYYLNLVADVVPFYPEDVLIEIEEETDTLSHKPRSRKKDHDYVELLSKYWTEDENTTEEEQRTHDAQLAKELIKKYSTELYNKLYKGEIAGGKPGSVNRTYLRKLLTARLVPGEEQEEWKKLRPKEPEKEDKEGKKKYKENAKNVYKYVFCYDRFSEKREKRKDGSTDYPRDIFRFLTMLGVGVCPYCNRQYITTVGCGDKRVRPQLDHFISKSRYPYLALSINNLIPSCAVCNLLKLDNEDKMIYPYEEGIEDNYVFRADFDKDDITGPLTGASNAIHKYEVKLVQNNMRLDDKYVERANNSIKNLALEKLYQSHSGYVADLHFQHYVFTDKFFEDTQKQFSSLFKTKEDVKYMARLMDYSQEKWDQRPLSKLTHDISEQLDELYKTRKE